MSTTADQDLKKAVSGLERRALSVQEIERPCYMMNVPLSLSTAEQNNPWMQRMDDVQRAVNYPRAYRQWMELYGFLAQVGFVYLLPSVEGYQDQTYVANVGLVPEHLKRVVLLARYKSPPRRGEEVVAEKFFDLMGFQIEHPPYDWEGEAETKHVRDNIYVGGYGIRTDPRVYRWMYEKLDMEVVPVRMRDEWLYHFDCMFFPMTRQEALVYVDGLDDRERKAVERVVNVIPVTKQEARQGITNSVRAGSFVLCMSDLNELKKTDDEYEIERAKVEKLTKECLKRGLEPVFFNLGEFEKSGAALSCLVMHLNRWSYVERTKQ